MGNGGVRSDCARAQHRAKRAHATRHPHVSLKNLVLAHSLCTQCAYLYGLWVMLGNTQHTYGDRAAPLGRGLN